jgi:hypothetical protein
VVAKNNCVNTFLVATDARIKGPLDTIVKTPRMIQTKAKLLMINHIAEIVDRDCQLNEIPV